MQQLSLAVIGAGKLGKTLTHLMVKHDLIHQLVVHNQTASSSLKALEFIGLGEACESVDALPRTDLVMISCPDDMIVSCARAYVSSHDVRGTVMFHASGCLSSDILSFCRDAGAHVASVHPMHSFARPDRSIQHFSGCYVSIEGDVAALSVLKPLFKTIGAMLFDVMTEKKALYHASAVFTANAPIALMQLSMQCLREAGIDEQLIKPMATNLLLGVTNNIACSEDLIDAFTGPYRRGDVGVIEQHLDALPASVLSIYRELGKTLVACSDAQNKQTMLSALVGNTSQELK